MVAQVHVLFVSAPGSCKMGDDVADYIGMPPLCAAVISRPLACLLACSLSVVLRKWCMLPESRGMVTWPVREAYAARVGGSSLADTDVVPSALWSACKAYQQDECALILRGWQLHCCLQRRVHYSSVDMSKNLTGQQHAHDGWQRQGGSAQLL